VGYSTYLYPQDERAREEFDQAIVLYQNGKYLESSQLYTRLLQENHKTVEVYYNLANCYAKLDDITNAVLFYERALKLSPTDESIIHNLTLANQKIGLEIIEVPDFFLLQKWRAFSSVLRSNIWTYLYIIFSIAFLVSFYKWLLGKNREVKKRSFFLAFISIFLVLLCFMASKTKFQLEYGQDSAIVISDELYLKSGPDIKSKDQRLLKGGVKVELIDEIGTWYKVKLANNETGWLEMKNLEQI
jgi:tetratricopeptide (TPR) repeat protein